MTAGITEAGTIPGIITAGITVPGTIATTDGTHVLIIITAAIMDGADIITEAVTAPAAEEATSEAIITGATAAAPLPEELRRAAVMREEVRLRG